MLNRYVDKFDYRSRFRILKGGKVSLVVSALIGSITLSFASPSGGVVTSGTANISQSGTVTNINQSTQNATINWQSFSIASNETVNFNQPNASSITLNRIIGNERSIINGALNANGQVWLLNSNGILFGKNASINTAGLLATTAQLSDNDFNAGNYKFKNASEASVINEGTIEIANNGSVILASNEVRNSGTIKAVKGKIHLVGAQEYSINLNGNSLVELTVDKGVLDALVENSGTILADGGEIYLTTNAVNELLDGMVNNTGVIEANSIDGITGYVELFAHGGTTNVSGTLKAEDGFIETSGKELSILDGTIIRTKNWLLDPTDVTIDSSNGAVGTSTVGVSVIESALAAGNVTIQADNNINVNANLSNNTASNNTLTLTADFDNNNVGDINVNSVITVGAGDGITLNYGSSGNLTMARNDATNSFTGKINLDATSVVNINGNPYTVITDRTGVGNISTNRTGNYVLAGNIDFTTTAWNTLSGFGNRFQGKLDGFGHIIENLTINMNDDQIGLFGQLVGASIKNIGFTGGTTTLASGKQQAGVLAGYVDSSTIYNSFSTNSVTTAGTNSNLFGGLIGVVANGTSVKSSYASGNVIANVGSAYGAGGLIGSMVWNGAQSTVSNSYATGEVKASRQAGGLIGSMTAGTVQNSYATGYVHNDGSSDGTSFGGLIGYLKPSNSGITVSRSYATGNVESIINGGSTSNNFVGGLIGISQYTGAYIPVVEYSYATGNVTTLGDKVGGLVGFNDGTAVSNSYATGNVDGRAEVGGLIGAMGMMGVSVTNSYSTGSATVDLTRVGGLIGYNPGSTPVTNSFWDTQTSGNVTSQGGTGKTTAEMKTLATFTGATWDFKGETANGTSDIWNISSTKNNGYPCLFGVGAGCSATNIYLRLITGSSVSGTTPNFTYGYYTTASAGTTVSDATPSGTVTWTGAPTIASSTGTYSMSYLSGITLGNSWYTLLAGDAVNWLVTAPVTSTTTTASTTVKPPVVQKSTPPKFTPNNFVVSQKVEKTPIVSQPIVGEKTKKVTQTEVQTMQNSETTLVPVGKGALLQLVNSGVTLPEGVEQEFYVVEDNRK